MDKEPKIHHYLSIFFRDVTSLGGAFFYGILVLFLILFKEYSFGLKLVYGFLITLIITVIIRKVYYRDRPNKETYSNLFERIDASSFPSLHASRVTFLVLALGWFFNFAWTFTTLFVILGLLIAYSRIFLRKHDWWDLLGGAILGVLTFWIITLI
jgi:membrane-associated phospholipid phosphatase